MKTTTVLKSFIVITLATIIVACSLPSNVKLSTCPSTSQDSHIISDVLFINQGHPGARYGLITLPRRRLVGDPDIAGAPDDIITIDYMVHETVGAIPAAVVVLIAGGNLDSKIKSGPGNTVSTSSGNFLVRSAPMFISTSTIPLRVITIDRPSDYKDDVADTDPAYAYDGYRTSMRHTVDLSAVINAENPENLPVFIAGTSRGATSTVANYMLAAGISLSSAASSGPNGRPVREDSMYPEVRPSRVTVPAHVLAHMEDACPRSTPSDSFDILNNLFNGLGDGVYGGFIGPNNPRVCGAFHHHGYLGIETCAVDKITTWMGNTFPAIPNTRPVANAVAGINTNSGTPVDIDLIGAVTPAIPAPLTFSLPHATTALGGAIALIGSVVTYTPPLGLGNKIDTFVYVVNEAGGGSSHQVVSVQIN